MTMPLLPTWLRAAWVVVLAMVLIVHVGHAYRTPGQSRWWHTGHVLMAAGMATMYLGATSRTILSRAGLGLFVAAALAAAAASALLSRQEGMLNPLWAILTVDMLIMAYMWLPAATRPATLDDAFATYLGCQVLAWALGLWDRVPILARSVTPPQPAARATTSPDAAVVRLTTHNTLAVRATLAVMAASMSYMLIAM